MQRGSILFVCTGNVFRSVSAEYALRKAASQFPEHESYAIASAGTEAIERPMHEFVLNALRKHTIDVSAHQPRRLNRDILESANLVVAMGIDHQTFIEKTFGMRVPLFREVCFDETQSVLDVHEAIPDFETRPDLAERHIQETVDYIVRGTPQFLSRFSKWI